MLFAITVRGCLLLLPILIPLELVLFYWKWPMNGLLLLGASLVIAADVGIQMFLGCFLLAEPWTLTVNRQTIRRCHHSLFRTKEWNLPTDDASVKSYDLDLLSCLFCWDAVSMQAFHFIELQRGDERFLFPCNDVDEQQKRVEEINAFLNAA